MFRLLLLSLLFVFASPVRTQDAPPTAGASLLPDSPWKARLATLATEAPVAPAEKLEKAALLRKELAFVPRRRWLLLPTLAKELSHDDEQRAAVRELLENGATHLREALAAEGADKDLGAATALLVVQLWQFALDKELSEAAQDGLHGQLATWLAVHDVAAMSDADKQKCWEFCVGLPTFLAAMAELVEEDEQRGELRKQAAVLFEALLGKKPEQVEITAQGLATKKGRRPRQPAAPKATPQPAPAAPVATTPAGHGAAPLPASGPAIRGVTWTEPHGWQKEHAHGQTVFRATLGNVDNEGRPEANNSATHQAAIAFLPVQTATEGPTALFERIWREQFAPFVLGDTFVHYRGRLPSQLVVLYMGRFFERPNTPAQHGNPDTYGGLWLVDLGGNRFQPLVAIVEPRDPGLGMDMFKESAALRALAFPLGKVLDSVKPADGAPPHPSGGYFAAQDLRGAWTESSSAYGGSYVNSVTGGFAGVAVSSSGGHFTLRDDGTYEYAFAYASSHPQFGNQGGSTRHDGTYTLNGDIVLVAPAKPINYTFTCCAVGLGHRQTPQGRARILVTVSAHQDGSFRQVPLIANWDQYQGVLTWYSEAPK